MRSCGNVRPSCDVSLGLETTVCTVRHVSIARRLKASLLTSAPLYSSHDIVSNVVNGCDRSFRNTCMFSRIASAKTAVGRINGTGDN